MIRVLLVLLMVSLTCPQIASAKYMFSWDYSITGGLYGNGEQGSDYDSELNASVMAVSNSAIPQDFDIANLDLRFMITSEYTEKTTHNVSVEYTFSQSLNTRSDVSAYYPFPESTATASGAMFINGVEIISRIRSSHGTTQPDEPNHWEDTGSITLSTNTWHTLHFDAAGEHFRGVGDEWSYMFTQGISEDSAHLSILTFDEPPSPTPIPGAIWLLGSGLFGLIGMRLKLRT